MTLLIFTLAFIFAVIVIRDILMRATVILHQAIIRHALTTNFARFGEAKDKTSRVVIVDRTRGYFLKNNVLWMCEVEDGEPDPTTAKPIDMFSLPDVEVIVKKMTEKAVLVSDTEDSKGVWLPKSQIEVEMKSPTSPYATVTMPEWLAMEKELI